MTLEEALDFHFLFLHHLLFPLRPLFLFHHLLLFEVSSRVRAPTARSSAACRLRMLRIRHAQTWRPSP